MQLLFSAVTNINIEMVNMNHPAGSRDLRESDANGFVQRAISAANVYNNIVKYIDDANITSLTTFNLSSSSEEVCRVLKEHANSLHCRPFATKHALLPVFQTVAEITDHLEQLVKQSDNVFKESVSLHSEQIGRDDKQSVRGQ